MDLKPRWQDECHNALKEIELDICRIESFQQTAESLLERTEACSRLVRLESIPTLQRTVCELTVS